MTQQSDGKAVSFQVGARVRTADGEKGEIVLLTKDGRYAYVRIASDGPGAHATLRPLDSLKKIGEVDLITASHDKVATGDVLTAGCGQGNVGKSVPHDQLEQFVSEFNTIICLVRYRTDMQIYPS